MGRYYNEIRNTDSLKYTYNSRVLSTRHYVGRCCTNVIRGHCYFLGQSCINATPGHSCEATSSNNALGRFYFYTIRGPIVSQQCVPLLHNSRSKMWPQVPFLRQKRQTHRHGQIRTCSSLVLKLEHLKTDLKCGIRVQSGVNWLRMGSIGGLL